jgi:hypothetical protein
MVSSMILPTKCGQYQIAHISLHERRTCAVLTQLSIPGTLSASVAWAGMLASVLPLPVLLPLPVPPLLPPWAPLLPLWVLVVGGDFALAACLTACLAALLSFAVVTSGGTGRSLGPAPVLL